MDTADPARQLRAPASAADLYAVLFGLSELARYQPVKWADAINITRSADAIALEHLMDTAHLACAT